MLSIKAYGRLIEQELVITTIERSFLAGFTEHRYSLSEACHH